MEKVKGLVIFTKPWNMVDETTGEKREGISIEYLMSENLIPVVNEDGSKGVRHCKESLNTNKLPKIKEVPGYYNLSFGMKVGSKGKPVIKLDDIEYIAPAETAKR